MYTTTITHECCTCCQCSRPCPLRYCARLRGPVLSSLPRPPSPPKRRSHICRRRPQLYVCPEVESKSIFLSFSSRGYPRFIFAIHEQQAKISKFFIGRIFSCGFYAVSINHIDSGFSSGFSYTVNLYFKVLLVLGRFHAFHSR